MKKRPSDSSLDKLFRLAARMNYHGRCGLCGKPGYQVHHIVPRRRVLTRWLLTNGILLCVNCHPWAHTNEGRQAVLRAVGDDECTALFRLEAQTYKQFLMAQGITDAEFRAGAAQTLRQFIARFN